MNKQDCEEFLRKLYKKKVGKDPKDLALKFDKADDFKCFAYRGKKKVEIPSELIDSYGDIDFREQLADLLKKI